MRALILHTDQFKSKTVEKSTRPEGIKSDPEGLGDREMQNGITVFFCVKKNDDSVKLNNLYNEILSAANDFKTQEIMIAPFAHLSNQTAEPKLAKKLYEELVLRFKETTFKIETSQFGYHKSLLLEIKGHPGSFRYREF